MALPHTCEDRRQPRLEGVWIVYCGPDGAADQVLDLTTGRREPLAEKVGAPIAARDAITPITRAPGLGAFGGPDFLAVFDEGSTSQRRYDARPAPWYAPAVGGGWILWTEIRGGDLDVSALPPDATDPVPFAAGPGPQHHAVAAGGRLAWVDRGDIVVADPAARTRSTIQAEAGFESAPVLLDGLVCWEDRGGDEIVVRCDDGWSVPGRMPSGSGAWLLVHTRLGAVLYGLAPDGGPAPTWPGLP